LESLKQELAESESKREENKKVMLSLLDQFKKLEESQTGSQTTQESVGALQQSNDRISSITNEIEDIKNNLEDLPKREEILTKEQVSAMISKQSTEGISEQVTSDFDDKWLSTFKKLEIKNIESVNKNAKRLEDIVALMKRIRKCKGEEIEESEWAKVSSAFKLDADGAPKIFNESGDGRHEVEKGQFVEYDPSIGFFLPEKLKSKYAEIKVNDAIGQLDDSLTKSTRACVDAYNARGDEGRGQQFDVKEHMTALLVDALAKEYDLKGGAKKPAAESLLLAIVEQEKDVHA
jgi:hypothetical protein